MSDENGNLRLLDDLPAAGGEDRFHHKVYASILQDVFLSNKAGLSVGLFGKWGQGKSSIVKLLREGLEGTAKVVVFNAWKASGDSVRRQLLLNILHEIAPKKAAELKRFVGLEIVESLLLTEKESQKKKLIAGLKTAFDPILWFKLFWPLAATVCLFFVGFLLVIFSLFNAYERGEIFLQLALALFFPAAVLLSVYVTKTVKQRYYGRLSISQPLSESQKLQYPEQFQEVLEKYVRIYCKERGRLIVVVDDLDRCDADTVAEALAAIRQFTIDQVNEVENFDCQFLVPCDERQVVLALESAGHDAGTSGGRYHDYQSEELLRKFFDVVVRMDEMLSDDLSDYAASLAEKVGLKEKEAREIVDMAGARDPREVKKLLNALRISHENIERRSGHLLSEKEQMENLEATERLLVVLRETVPEAYKKVCANPSFVKGFLLDETETRESRKQDGDKTWPDPQITKANAIIERAGIVSEPTATNLIYGRLDPELRPVPVGGLLMKVFMNDDETGFSDALSSIRPEDNENVQAWLTKKTRRARSDASLRNVLRLFLSYAEHGGEKAAGYIAPCIEEALMSPRLLKDVISGFKRYKALELVWPYVSSTAKNLALVAFYANFEKESAKTDLELEFLLKHARELDESMAMGLRSWMKDEIEKSEGDDEFVGRLFKALPKKEEQKACYGFAPEIAVLLAQRSEWMDDADEESQGDMARWPRYNLILAFVGDSEEQAAQCLHSIFTENGQLAFPQEITDSTPGVEPAWKTVAHLLSLVSDGDVQANFDHIETWLNHQSQSKGLETILDALGKNAFRLSSDQMGQLAQFLVNRLQSQPSETYLVGFIGKEPDRDDLREGWLMLVSEFIARYFQWLEGRTALSLEEGGILGQIRNYRWSISEQAESLLVQKMCAPDVSDFGLWLEALVPLIGNRRINLREAVADCFNKNERVKQAFSAGNCVLWKNEIDAEVAAVIGRFFIEYQSEIPTYSSGWESLREKKGSERVLEVMEENLPNESETLVSYGLPLDMLAEGFEQMGAQNKLSFLNKRLVPLIGSTDSSAIQMGLNLASALPAVSEELKKQLKSLQKDEKLDNQQRYLIKEILEKPKVKYEHKSRFRIQNRPVSPNPLH